MRRKHISRGYVAILVVMLIAAILTSLALTDSFRSLLYLSDQTDTENHIQGILLAKSCAFIALQTLENNPDYIPASTTLAISSKNTCVIDTIISTDNSARIFTHSYLGKTLSIIETDIQLPIAGVPVVTKQFEATSIPP